MSRLIHGQKKGFEGPAQRRNILVASWSSDLRIVFSRKGGEDTQVSISFYEAGVETYGRILDSVAGMLEKGTAYAEENGKDPNEIVMAKLVDNMMPLHFQVVSVCHHSWGALQGMRDGKFAPPSFDLDKNYEELQALLKEARAGVSSFSEEDANNLASKSLTFNVGGTNLSFTNENFLLTFSLPNLYFHATTNYGILRMLGVPLGKMDFLGAIKIG